MDKLLRSRHLSVKREGDVYHIFHQQRGISVRVGEDVINLVNEFEHWTEPIEIKKKFNEDSFLKAIELLVKNQFLQSKSDHEKEAELIFLEWSKRFGKKTRGCFEGNQHMRYAFSAGAPVNEIQKQVARVFKEIAAEVFPYPETIYLCFLEPKEYKTIRKNWKIPKGVSAFVDRKTVLLMDYQAFFYPNDPRNFYPYMRHEAVHLLIGQYVFYLPFWFEEGLCEYYSKKYFICTVNYFIRSQELLSFYKINQLNIGYLSQYKEFEAVQDCFYLQAQSFVHFLIDRIGMERLWKIIARVGIERNFDRVLTNFTGESLFELQFAWEKRIRGKRRG